MLPAMNVAPVPTAHLVRHPTRRAFGLFALAIPVVVAPMVFAPISLVDCDPIDAPGVEHCVDGHPADVRSIDSTSTAEPMSGSAAGVGG